MLRAAFMLAALGAAAAQHDEAGAYTNTTMDVAMTRFCTTRAT